MKHEIQSCEDMTITSCFYRTEKVSLNDYQPLMDWSSAGVKISIEKQKFWQFADLPMGKNISNGLRGTTTAANQSGKIFQNHLKSFKIIWSSAVRKIVQNWKTFETALSLSKVDLPEDLLQDQTL